MNMEDANGIERNYDENGMEDANRREGNDEVEISLLKSTWTPDTDQLPPVVQAKGLSLDRSWYLYENIRQFCPSDEMYLTCPLPASPKPSSRAGTPTLAVSESNTRPTITTPPTLTTPSSSHPPSKRLCGVCRQPGHNARNCPTKT